MIDTLSFISLSSLSTCGSLALPKDMLRNVTGVVLCAYLLEGPRPKRVKYRNNNVTNSCESLRSPAISAGGPHKYENGRHPHSSQAASFSFDSDGRMEDGAADDRLPPEDQVRSGVASFGVALMTCMMGQPEMAAYGHVGHSTMTTPKLIFLPMHSEFSPDYWTALFITSFPIRRSDCSMGVIS